MEPFVTTIFDSYLIQQHDSVMCSEADGGRCAVAAVTEMGHFVFPVQRLDSEPARAVLNVCYFTSETWTKELWPLTSTEYRPNIIQKKISRSDFCSKRSFFKDIL